MSLRFVTIRPVAAAFLLSVVTLAAPIAAYGQNDSGSGSQNQSQDQSQSGSNSDNSSSQDGGGNESFLQSIVPGFLQGWLGMGGGSSSDQASSSGGSGKGSGGKSQPPAVVVTPAVSRSVGDSYEFIGRIQAIEHVALRARVNGFIQKVFFHGGDNVQTGEKLFQIEPAQYQANLQSAKAQLVSAKAQEDQAQRSLKRNQELAQNGTVATAQLDDARATYESARGRRLQAEAQERRAQLALDYTTITAPIDGQISEPFITKGNYVTASSGALANLIQLTPIWGTFPVGEDRLATWRRVGGGASQTDDPDNAKASGYRMSLVLPNGDDYHADGALSFVANTVDTQTGTIAVRVTFPNEDGVLLPNENVTMVAEEKDPPRQPVVPQAAIQLDRDGSYIFVYDPSTKTVRRQPVETGKNMTGDVAIQSGLKEGDLVVTQGLQNISDGQKVNANREDRTQAPGGPLRDQGGSGSASEAGVSSSGGGGGGGGEAPASSGDTASQDSGVKTASSGSSGSEGDGGQ